jgi:hypothetical protein
LIIAKNLRNLIGFETCAEFNWLSITYCASEFVVEFTGDSSPSYVILYLSQKMMNFYSLFHISKNGRLYIEVMSFDGYTSRENTVNIIIVAQFNLIGKY